MKIAIATRYIWNLISVILVVSLVILVLGTRYTSDKANYGEEKLMDYLRIIFERILEHTAYTKMRYNISACGSIACYLCCALSFLRLQWSKLSTSHYLFDRLNDLINNISSPKMHAVAEIVKIMTLKEKEMQAWSAIIWRGVGGWGLGRRRNMEKDEKKVQGVYGTI